MVDFPYEYPGEGYVIYITMIWGGIYWFIMDLVYPVNWVNPQLLELVGSLNSEWESITEFHPPPCELFHYLLFFLWILIILPTYNGVEFFWKILIGKVLYGLLDFLDVPLKTGKS